MPTKYRTSTDYYRTVLTPSDQSRQWAGIRLAAGREASNHVAFASVAENTLNVTLTGTAWHESRMDGKISSKPTEPDEIIAMPAGISAEFSWGTHDDCERSLVLQFDDALFEMHTPEIVSGNFVGGHLTPSDYCLRPELVWLVKQLGQELDSTQRRGAIYAESLIRLLALEVARTLWTNPAHVDPPTEKSDARIRRVIDLIEADFAEDLGLRQLALEAGLQPGQFIEIFKRHTGKTPYSFLIDRRLRHAVELLCRTDTQIGAIAIACGFADQQHLTRAFRKRLGRTPASYRRQTRPATAVLSS